MGLRQRLGERFLEGEITGRTAKLNEALAELETQELMLEDLGWLRLSGFGEDVEFSEAARDQINKLALYYWIKNPLAGRAVETMTHYTFGRGVTVTGATDDVGEVIEEFWDDEDNKLILTRHQAQEFKSTELQIFGNVFLVLFSNMKDGHIKMGDIPQGEIRDVIRSADNRKQALYYKRAVSLNDYDYTTHSYRPGQSETWYYPDWKSPEDAQASRQTNKGAVYHIKVNCISDMKFGISELYRAMDWLKAYNKFLENWASITAAFARFAWKKKVKGGSSVVAAEKAKLESGLTKGTETNPAPASGSMWIENMGSELQPLRTAGATTSAADGRHMKLMVSAATGIFEHYFGDAAVGNLASCTAMELPMLKMFESRQQLWRDVITDLVKLEVEQAVAYGRLKVKDPDDLKFDVQMPPIVTKDVPQLVGALVNAVNLGAGGNKDGILPMETATRQVLSALGEENPEKVISEMYQDTSGKPTEQQKQDFAGVVEHMSESLQEILERAI